MSGRASKGWIGLLVGLTFLAPGAGTALAQSSASYRLSIGLVQGASSSAGSTTLVAGCLEPWVAGRGASASWAVLAGCAWGTGLYAGLPHVNVVSGGGAQTAQVNQPFPQPLEVVVTDPFGAPVAGATVVFTAPTSGASCTLGGGGSAVTDGTGGVSVTATANATTGAYSVGASVSGLPPVAFSLANTTVVPVELQSFTVD